MQPSVVYVVLTHRGWAQVERLTRTILASAGDARVLLVHDERGEHFPQPDDPRCRILRHGLAADWGSWELVEATLAGFAEARRWSSPDLVVLLSGQDYPARELAEWEKIAVEAPGWLGTAHPLSYRPKWGRRRGEGDDTWTRYGYVWMQSPAARRGMSFDTALAKAWRRARDAAMLRMEPLLTTRSVHRGRGVYYGLRRTHMPGPVFVGSQWLAVRRDELDALLDVHYAPGSTLRRLYRRSIIPDESALVTPLSWQHPAADLPPVSAVWWESARDRPKVLTEADFDAITASGSPFCRKVEPGVSDGLLTMLDARVMPDTAPRTDRRSG
ncbi:hypothetical protein [Microbacterium aureliae]